MAYVRKGTDAWLARRVYVRDAVRREAEIIQFSASVFLAQHRDTGKMRVTVRKGRKTDYFVELTDGSPRSRKQGDGAVAFEYGHFTPDGKWVPGANIMGRAAFE